MPGLVSIEQRSMSPEESAVALAFEHHLEGAEPYLRELAWQIMNDYPERQWDLVVGDDTGGRLVTHFVRTLLRERWDTHMPTGFICASHRAQSLFTPEAYDRHVDHIADSTGASRPLVVTENTSTGRTMLFLDEHLRNRFESADYAVLSAREVPTGLSGRVYVGGEGAQAAEAVYNTFERVGDVGVKDFIVSVAARTLPLAVRRLLSGRSKLTDQPTYPLTNIEFPDNIGPEDVLDRPPIAMRSEDTQFRRSAAYCYERMDQLARNFADEHAGGSVACPTSA